jgi:inosine-uridine nucleoside N-ribohydrolase
MSRIATIATIATALLIGLAACSGGPEHGPDIRGVRPSVRPLVAWTDPGRPRPIVVDTDGDADDLVALAILAGESRVQIRAVTVTGTGIVHCGPGVDLVRRWLRALDRANVPVACGRQEPGPGGRRFPDEWRARADAGFGLDLPQAGVVAESNAVDLLVATSLAADGELVVVALGPWTNIADAVRRDAAFGSRLAAVHAMLGTIDAAGNVDLGDTHPDDRVEWNAGADPDAVAAVLGGDAPITLVPLDATNSVPLTLDLAESAAGVGAGTGADLVSQLYLRNPDITAGGQSLWDSLTAVLLTRPGLATWGVDRIEVATHGTAAGRVNLTDRGRPARFATEVDPRPAFAAWLAALARTKVPITPDGRLRP